MIHLSAIGHLGQDCVIRDIAGRNQKTISFSLAHTEKYRDAQGVQQERTTWISCTLWRDNDRTAIAQYLVKGALVHVSGIPTAHGYQGRDGQIRGDLKLNVKEVSLLSVPKRENAPSNYEQTLSTYQNQTAPATAPVAGTGPVPPPDDLFVPEGGGDDLPF